MIIYIVNATNFTPLPATRPPLIERTQIVAFASILCYNPTGSELESPGLARHFLSLSSKKYD